MQKQRAHLLALAAAMIAFPGVGDASKTSQTA